jgi:GTP-binding protein EngB required for normal cell division
LQEGIDGFFGPANEIAAKERNWCVFMAMVSEDRSRKGTLFEVMVAFPFFNPPVPYILFNPAVINDAMTKEVVLIGRSNVGKSTLFRALTGRRVDVGRRPGITRTPFKAKVGNAIYVDMPGYGFMKHLSSEEQERTKDLIIEYFLHGKEEIILAIQVIDAASFLDIADRWQSRGEVPLEIELYDFLSDLGLDVALAANKMDRISNKDEALDGIVERLGMLPPWRQWIDRVAPISAKKGDIEPLRRIISASLCGKRKGSSSVR